jgi:MFS transporter, FSR family, fosmidomycin resistance protein
MAPLTLNNRAPVVSDDIKKTSVKVIVALTLVHFVGDFYSSFTTPLLPAFAEKLSLSMAQVGLVAGIGRFLAFVVQPLAGFFADRYQTRDFILGGLLLAIIFTPLSGIASSLPILILVVSLGSIGSSMFHPSVAGMIPRYAGKNSGLSMSIFNTGGTLAFAIGPVFITSFVAAWELEAIPVTMLIGLFAVVFLFRWIPLPVSEDLSGKGILGSIKETLGPVWRVMLLLWLLMVLRAIVGQSFLTFIPVLFVNEGSSLVSVGGIYSLFTLAGTASGILCGYFSDRIGYKLIFLLAHGLMTPVLFLFLHLSGGWVYPGAFLAGFVVLATLPLGVVMAQELAPKGKSMAASLMMGLAYGTGGLVAPLVGWLADMYSIREVLSVLFLIPLLSCGLIFLLPRMKSRSDHPSGVSGKSESG